MTRSRDTGSNAGAGVKVRNEGGKVDKLSNYLNEVVVASVNDTEKTAKGRYEGKIPYLVSWDT